MRKRIVQIGKYYPPFSGGIENNTEQVAEILLGRYRSYVVCMLPQRGVGRARRASRVPVIELRSMGSVWRQQISAPLAPMLERLKPDCLHFHAPNPLLALYVDHFLRRDSKTKLVVTHHADLERPESIRRVANAGYRRLLHKADWLITYTDHAFSASRELEGFESKKMIIPHGVRIPDSVAAAVGRSGNDSFRDGDMVLGFLGRLEKWKGVQVLLEAVKELPSVSVKIAGNGSYRTQLEEQVRASNLQDRVTFVAQVQGAQKWKFLTSLSALVLPSLSTGETFGQVLVEAQLVGVPVVASDLPTGIQEIIGRNEAGLLVEPGNAEALRMALVRLENRDVRERLAENGEQRAKSRFTESVIAEKLLKFYDQNVFGS